MNLLNQFRKIAVFIQDYYFLAGFLVLAFAFGLLTLISSLQGERDIHNAVTHAVELNELKHKKEAIHRDITAANTVKSYLQQKRTLRADSLLQSTALLDSLQTVYEESLHSPNHDSAEQLELFFARYYESAHPHRARPLH